MSRKFFGTDGIRGRTNEMPMTAAMAQRVGQAAGAHFQRGDHRHRVVIGKDTRLSGYMMETALISGFTSVGMDVVMVGPVPTPAVAMLTRSMRADLGVMISASHNKFADNGIKLFGPNGYKLSDADEAAIERLLDEEAPRLVPAEQIGRSRKIEDARGRYIHSAKTSFPEHLRLDGLKVVIDCAHGAAYQVAPSALWELGAEVTALGVNPNGLNINEGCGSTDTALLSRTVVESGADIGLALDGDADRLIVVDEKGKKIDGDQMMALIGSAWHRTGQLKGGGVVATIMSNLGLERYFEGMGLKLERTQVGDRYVLERMRAGGFNVGGEQSGHMILTDYGTTGDGLVAGLQVLAELVVAGKPASEVLNRFEPLPQLLKNVRFKGKPPLDRADVQAAIADGEARLNGRGRVVIRKSGTEPLIRVMAEGEDEGWSAKWWTISARRWRRDLRVPRVLIIAGSDSGGGAGIQADIKTVTMLGGHAMTAITAITAQNTLGVDAVMPVPTEMVMAQIEAVVSDIGVDVVKIGMIGSAETARAIAERLDPARPGQITAPPIHVVLDPVMVATSGAVLADVETIETFELLMRRANVITPNVAELGVLTGREISSVADLVEAGHQLSERTRTAVLAKGGHLPPDDSGDIADFLIQSFLGGGETVMSWADPVIQTRHTHGTGCTLASAVATCLGAGMKLSEAVIRAREFVRGALLAAPGFGNGHGPMGHWAANDANNGRMNLNQVTLPARDYDEAADFYRRLGLTQIVDSPDNGYARFECPGGATLSIHVEREPQAGDAVVYLESTDLDEWTKALWRAGIKVAQKPRDERWGWREARLTDPTGNKLCLYRAGDMRRFPPWRISTAK